MEVGLLSLLARLLKNLLAMQETQVRFLGWEDPLEKEMATHSSILAWRIAWTEEPGRLQSTGRKSQTQLSDSGEKENRAFCAMSSWMFKVLAGLTYLTLRRPAEESGL